MPNTFLQETAAKPGEYVGVMKRWKKFGAQHMVDEKLSKGKYANLERTALYEVRKFMKTLQRRLDRNIFGPLANKKNMFICSLCRQRKYYNKYYGGNIIVLS